MGMSAPPARVTLMDGSWVALDALRGKTVVLVFWQNTCAKSKQLLGKLGEFAKKYERRPTVEFVAVSVDKAEHRADVEERIRAIGSRKIVYAFSGNEVYDEAYRLFKGEEVPYVLVINAKGTVIAAGDSAAVYEAALLFPGLVN